MDVRQLNAPDSEIGTTKLLAQDALDGIVESVMSPVTKKAIFVTYWTLEHTPKARHGKWRMVEWNSPFSPTGNSMASNKREELCKLLMLTGPWRPTQLHSDHSDAVEVWVNIMGTNYPDKKER